MGLALRSAELAAEMLSANSDLRLVQRGLQKEFVELWRWRRMIWRSVAMLVSRPILCELAVDVMNVTNVGERIAAWGKDERHGQVSTLAHATPSPSHGNE
jgi:hypothetical protein